MSSPCNNNCDQGQPYTFRDKSENELWGLVVKGLAMLGMYTAAMFILGYLWASYVPAKTCTPDLLDRVLK